MDRCKQISIKEIPLYSSPFTKMHVFEKDHIFDRIIQKHGLHQQKKSVQKQNVFVDGSLRVSYFWVNIRNRNSARSFFFGDHLIRNNAFLRSNSRNKCARDSFHMPRCISVTITNICYECCLSLLVISSWVFFKIAIPCLRFSHSLLHNRNVIFWLCQRYLRRCAIRNAWLFHEFRFHFHCDYSNF